MGLNFAFAGLVTVAAAAAGVAPQARAVAQDDPATRDAALQLILARLDAVEQQNRELARQIAELTSQNAELRSGSAASAPPSGDASPPAASPGAAGRSAAASNLAATSGSTDQWAGRIRLGGDFRFRHETIDDDLLDSDRTRQTIRARLGAAIQVNDTVSGEIGFSSGGAEPRGGSATLGSASSRKEIGLDLAYMTLRPFDDLGLTFGKMREPYVRPGRSGFFDNEIRPEGIAATYKNGLGLFGSAFGLWLEERPASSDSMLYGAQVGWTADVRDKRLKLGAGYYDYSGVQGRNPNFGGGLVGAFGNSTTGSGASTVYLYDYDIGQLFAEARFALGSVPLVLAADLARNFAADNGLEMAYSAGVQVGSADQPGRWEAGVLAQQIEKDALFAQWIDSDFAGGFSDNDGFVYRFGWMPIPKTLINLTYYDTRFNVDVGDRTGYDRWQLEFNVTY